MVGALNVNGVSMSQKKHGRPNFVPMNGQKPQDAQQEVSEYVPAYPCPICYPNPLYGGVGNVYSVRETIVYLRCNRCSHTWSAIRRQDAVLVNCVMSVKVLKTS